MEKKKYLCISFKCCNAYSRIYKNKDETAYVGRCPRCLKSIRINIGSGGTSGRFFEVY